MFESSPYFAAIRTNKPLIDLYIENAKSLGVEFKEDHLRESLAASSDMGNVSAIKPSIHPLYKIKTEGINHTHHFTKAVGLDENQLPTLNSGKSMAMTAIDVVCNPELIVRIKADFENGK